MIDLRFLDELERKPSPFAPNGASPQAAVDYINIPLDVDQDLDWPTTLGPAEALSEMYVRLLETNRRHVAASLTTIARARPGGVLFHCHAGKDRTGLIAAMTLGAVGVPADVIAGDYALAHPLYEQRRQRVLAEQATQEQRRYLEVLSAALPETMLLTLDYLDRRYGGVEGFLRTTPLLPADLDLLRKRLVENPAIDLSPFNSPFP